VGGLAQQAQTVGFAEQFGFAAIVGWKLDHCHAYRQQD
jgi:hypothetical protein